MLSLFSSFDIFIYSFCNAYFISAYLILMSSCMFINSLSNQLLMDMKNNLYDFFFSLCSLKITKFSHSLFIVLFIYMLMNNFISMFPFIFSLTSHIMFILTFSLTMWLSINLFFSVNKFSGFILHLIPTGTPMALVFFMFMIELVSNMIRPLTLTVRLMANILSGHLLMILLSSLVSLSSLSGIVSLLFYTFLSFIESLVSFIQSYIFCTLTCLYYSDLF